MSNTDRAAVVKGLRRLATRPAPAGQWTQAESDTRCELCGMPMPENHKHLLDLDERRMLCTCAMCWSMRSGDAEFRPAGVRRMWLEHFALTDELWAEFKIPIGLAFFMRFGAEGRVAALYPSPLGATECELDLEAWDRLEAANPVLAHLEPDCEALLVNRLADEPQFAIAPIDECYRLVGLIKANWEGISGGDVLDKVVPEFFATLREAANVG